MKSHLKISPIKNVCCILVNCFSLSIMTSVYSTHKQTNTQAYSPIHSRYNQTTAVDVDGGGFTEWILGIKIMDRMFMTNHHDFACISIIRKQRSLFSLSLSVSRMVCRELLFVRRLQAIRKPILCQDLIFLQLSSRAND